MTDPRALRPKTENEVNILRAALAESVDQFTALTGKEPSMPYDRLSYHEQMDILDNQVREFCKQHMYKEDAKLPRLILWTEGADITCIDKRVRQTVPTPRGYDKVASWRSLGQEFVRKRQLNNTALELAARGLKPSTSRISGAPQELATGRLSIPSLQAQRCEAMRPNLTNNRNISDIEAEKSRLDDFISKNVNLYMAWLNTLALDWFEADQARVPDHDRIIWDHWCSFHAPYCFEQYFEPETAPFLGDYAMMVKRGGGLPTVSFEDAERGRNVFRASENKVVMSDQSQQYFGAIKTGKNPFVSPTAIGGLVRKKVTVEKLPNDVGDTDKDAKVSYDCDVDSSGYSCDIDRN